MGKKFVLTVITFLTLVIFMPISVKAENRVYFEKEEINIAPGETKKINIIVDSDEDFTKVNFSLITTSNNVNFKSVDFVDSFVRNSTSSTGSNYELQSNEPQKSGTVIGSVTIGAKDTSELGEEGYIRLIKTAITSSKLINLSNSQLKFTVSKDKSSNNYLSNLSSNITEIDFKKDVLDYNVTVDENIDKFDLTAVAEDLSASVNISDQTLDKDVNLIKVTVLSETGKERIYKVTVNKKGSEKKDPKKVTKTTEVKNNSKERPGKSSWIILLVFLSSVIILDILYIKKK